MTKFDSFSTVIFYVISLFFPRAGLRQILACLRAEGGGGGGPTINVFGFNWSPKHWMTHKAGSLLPKPLPIRALILAFAVIEPGWLHVGCLRCVGDRPEISLRFHI